MKNKYELIIEALSASPKKWLITGVAGFIGSNLLETLLLNGQVVIGLDNFATGHQRNLDEVKILVGERWGNFKFIESDIRDLGACRAACDGVDYVLHQAALGSVPRSINDPIATNSTNIDGFLNMLVAARDAQVKSFTYAASSSTYGDHPELPKVEDVIGNPLSPYAVTKYVNELYADVFAKAYEFKAIGLRYFNVFGKRQDPNGAYAAVIPKWIKGLLEGEEIVVNGDGSTSRDFCYIKNVVQANILASVAGDPEKNEIYNIANGDRTTLIELLEIINNSLKFHTKKIPKVVYKGFRSGDVLHSQASIDKARIRLNYSPSHNVRSGIEECVGWYALTANI